MMNPILTLVLLLQVMPIYAGNLPQTALPNSKVTPGALNGITKNGVFVPTVTQSNIKTTICIPGYTGTIRPDSNYTNKLKINQLSTTYNYSDNNPSKYEEDHFMPLALNGNPTSELNLWPQPRNIAWGATKKDQLETYLHRAVCKGKITLIDAQNAFFTDWVVSYKKYIIAK